LKYKSTTGRVSFEKINGGGQGTAALGTAAWATNWTALSPLRTVGDGQVLIYKISDGDAKVLKLNVGSSGTTTVWTSSWSRGWF
jgi:hypothetical protein